jgi:polyisoprenoid-binding protein YceI
MKSKKLSVVMFNFMTRIIFAVAIMPITTTFILDMKKMILFGLLAAISMSFLAPASYKVDTGISNIVWTGYKVTGQHTGNVKIKNGTLTTDNGQLTGGSFEIDMTSITCTDLQGDMAGKLVGHLKSADFFGTDAFPTAKYVITKAIPTDTKGNYKIVGNLTIKSTTKEVKFNAVFAEKDGAVYSTGNMKVDRSDFDVRYGSGSFFDGLGDKTIYDEFDLQISITAKK